jgi:biotin transport system substrate-specific component
MGYLMEKKTIKRVNNYAVIGVVGLFIINFSGALQLYLVTKLNIQTIFLAGILPFLVGDIIKILAASFIAYKLKLTLNPRRMM